MYQQEGKGAGSHFLLTHLGPLGVAFSAAERLWQGGLQHGT